MRTHKEASEFIETSISFGAPSPEPIVLGYLLLILAYSGVG